MKLLLIILLSFTFTSCCHNTKKVRVKRIYITGYTTLVASDIITNATVDTIFKVGDTILLDDFNKYVIVK